MKLAVAAAVIGAIFVTALISRPATPISPPNRPVTLASSDAAQLCVETEGSPAGRSIAEVLAALPTRIDGLKDSQATWAELEAALLADPESVLPLLLERYSREADPALKGLLAVLIAIDPSTHPLLIADCRSMKSQDADLYRGFALFALVREVDPDSRRRQWSHLLNLVDLGERAIRLERRLRLGMSDPETLRLYDQVHGIISRGVHESGEPYTLYIGGQGHADFELGMDVEGTVSHEVRELLLEVHLQPWEWDWINVVSRYALQKSARKDPEFAATLVTLFLERGDVPSMESGLRILSSAQLPEASVATVIQVARSWLHQKSVFRDAVDLLGEQKGVEIHPALLELHGMTRDRDDQRVDVLWAMRRDGNSAYEPVAWLELESPHPVLRRLALGLLAKVNAPASIVPVAQALRDDPDKDVREESLEILVRANRWSPLEEEVLAHAAASEKDAKLRRVAQRLLNAKDRTCVACWDDPEEGVDESN